MKRFIKSIRDEKFVLVEGPNENDGRNEERNGKSGLTAEWPRAVYVLRWGGKHEREARGGART
jgi:hypothetical protein